MRVQLVLNRFYFFHFNLFRFWLPIFSPLSLVSNWSFFTRAITIHSHFPKSANRYTFFEVHKYHSVRYSSSKKLTANARRFLRWGWKISDKYRLFDRCTKQLKLFQFYFSFLLIFIFIFLRLFVPIPNTQHSELEHTIFC